MLASMSRALSYRQARAFYDRFGARQDSQAFYEDPALRHLIAHGSFETAGSVFELGCGTGRLACWLLARHLPESAVYLGCDISLTMARLASRRLRPYAARSLVVQTGGGALPAVGSRFDRFLSTYVLDLLSEDAAAGAVAEAHRLLTPGGKLCLVGITAGRAPLSRLVMSAWSLVQRLAPAAVGGCRPTDVRELLPASRWRVEHHAVVARFGVASQVLVASPVPA
jgi:SAM-dependent methyltransferase